MSYEKEFRRKLGFTNQEKLKKYFKATDIFLIDWELIEQYNGRIKEIYRALNQVVHDSIKMDSINQLCNDIDVAYNTIRSNNLIQHFNNNGRKPEAVYYNWMRGYAICRFFMKAISVVFNVPEASIEQIGGDDLTQTDTFSKTPTADLSFTKNEVQFRLEIQSGYTGVNDIKEHKIIEARRKKEEENIQSIVLHFDLFNGKAAIINLLDNSISSWPSRQAFENVTVYSIPEMQFTWLLEDEPPLYEEGN